MSIFKTIEAHGRRYTFSYAPSGRVEVRCDGKYMGRYDDVGVAEGVVESDSDADRAVVQARVARARASRA